MGNDSAKPAGSAKPEDWESEAWGRRPVVGRDRVTRGNYLRCYCPLCGARLNEGDRAVFLVENAEGQTGTVRVAAYLNVHEHETDLPFEEGEPLHDLKCPHCRGSLILEGETCPEDGSKLCGFQIASGPTKLPLKACVGKDCHWYHLDPDDEDVLMLEGSDEW